MNTTQRGMNIFYRKNGRDHKYSLTLYTLKSVSIFSLLFPKHFLRCCQGEYVRQSCASVGDHFFIFVTLMCDSGIIFKDKTTISHVLKASDLNC